MGIVHFPVLKIFPLPGRRSLLVTAGGLFIAASFVVLAAFYYYFTWSSRTPLLDGDDAVYLLMADYFSPFPAHSAQVTELVMRHSQFPPFYPLVLALTGGTLAHLAVAHAVTTTFLLGSVLIAFLWTQMETGHAGLAYVLSLLFALTPFTFFQSLGILSENLYLFVTLAALWFLARSRGADSWQYAGALAVGLAAVTRSIGLALVAAYAVHLFLAPRQPRWRFIGISLVPLLVWNVWKSMHDYHGSYLQTLSNMATAASPLGLLRFQLHVAPAQLWHGWITTFDQTPSSYGLVIGVVLAIICLVGLLHRLRNAKLDAIYVVFYLLIIFFWPFSYEARRFIYALLPILLLQGLSGMTAVSRASGNSRVALVPPYGYVTLMALSIIAPVSVVMERFVAGQRLENRAYSVSPTWYSYPDLARAKERVAEQLRLVSAWEGLRDFVPANECVYHIKPVPLMLYSDRISYAPPIVNNDKSEFLQETTRCHFFYIGAYTYLPYRGAFYPQEYLQDATRVISVDYIGDPSRHLVLGMLVERQRH